MYIPACVEICDGDEDQDDDLKEDQKGICSAQAEEGKDNCVVCDYSDYYPDENGNCKSKYQNRMCISNRTVHDVTFIFAKSCDDDVQ